MTRASIVSGASSAGCANPTRNPSPPTPKESDIEPAPFHQPASDTKGRYLFGAIRKALFRRSRFSALGNGSRFRNNCAKLCAGQLAAKPLGHLLNSTLATPLAEVNLFDLPRARCAQLERPRFHLEAQSQVSPSGTAGIVSPCFSSAGAPPCDGCLSPAPRRFVLVESSVSGAPRGIAQRRPSRSPRPRPAQEH